MPAPPQLSDHVLPPALVGLFERRSTDDTVPGRAPFPLLHAHPTPAALARLAEHLAAPGAARLATLSDRELLDAWSETVATFLDPRSAERARLDPALAGSARLSPAGLEAGLRTVLGGVARGPAGRLFDRARRRGRPSHDGRPALVVLAGNLPALAVQPLLPALAVRRPVLLKSSSDEPLFAPAFVDALVRRLPPLADALAALTWPGGARELEAPLLERSGVLVAYGGAGAVASLAERATHPERLGLYGPKTSLALVGRDAPLGEAAEAVSRDVALFDQRGCLSVTAVYVEGGPEGEGEGEERARLFGRELARALARRARELPPGPLDPATAAALQGFRAEADLAGLERPEVTDDLAAGTVVVADDPAFVPGPGGRAVRVLPVTSLERVPALLAPWRGRLQGAAFAGRRAAGLAAALARLGCSRITPVGKLQSADALWHDGGVAPLDLLAGRVGAPRSG